MTLPTWEIVLITLIAITVLAASIYVFIRCWTSIKALYTDKSAPQRSTVTRQTHTRTKGQPLRTRPGVDVPEIYGVPYKAPDEPPKQLNPATLGELVMGKSELHPSYLEKREHVIDERDATDDNHRDQRVTWHGSEILIESEFAPSVTEVGRNLSPTSSVISDGGSTASPRPRRKVLISYDTDSDGSPSIKSITTQASLEEDLDPPTEVMTCDVSTDHVDTSHVELSQARLDVTKTHSDTHATPLKPNQKHGLSTIPESWVEFDQSDLV